MGLPSTSPLSWVSLEGVVTGWSIVAGAKTMYNFEVAQDHTFVVGDGQWVVHNCGTPGGYLSNKAPKAVTPGTRTLEGVYVNDLGQPEPWVAHYDEYGRMIGRTDYTTGNAAQSIEPTHYHVYSYTEFFGDGRSFADHVPGVFDPNDWLSL